MKKNNLKILITGSSLTGNKGTVAMFLGTKRILSETLKEFNPVFSMLTPYYSEDKKIAKKYDVMLYGYQNLSRKLNLLSFFKNNILVIKAYTSSDLVVDISGINYCDSDSFLSTTINRSLFIIPALILKKPFIKFTQSFGPIKKSSTKIIAKFFLNRCKLIIPRDKKSKECLEKIGIKKKLNICVDSAFGMKVERIENFKRKKLLVGISPSQVICNKSKEYIFLMAKIIDFLIEKLRTDVIIVPHCSKFSKYQKFTASTNDDFPVVLKIINNSKYRKNIIFYNKDYTPQRLKGIIGSCDFFIGSRYHSLIASISMEVPSIAIGWNYKYDGLFETAGIKKYSLSFRDLTYENLQDKVLELFKERDSTKTILNQNYKKMLRSSYRAGKLVKDFIIDYERKKNNKK